MPGMRVIHTADWQIGKPFRNFGEKESVLRQARLSAIESIGRLARRGALPAVLVAATYMTMTHRPGRRCSSSMERMRAFADPSCTSSRRNHDYHRNNGLWDRVVAEGLPGNVHLHSSRPRPRP